MNTTFDPQTLADDRTEIHRIYSRFFHTLDESSWDKPTKGRPKEWTLHETIAHLSALNGAGLESIKHTLRGEPYTFIGLDNRYKFNAYNRKGIDDHLAIPMRELCAELLNILDEAASIARNLQPGQAELAASMPIYNRPVKIVEALSIIVIHAGFFHSAQVAEPAGLPPLWTQFSPEIRHRLIGRAMRASSLVYRPDIGGSLRATLVFRIDGPGGGEWYSDLSPEASTSGEGVVDHPGLLTAKAIILIHGYPSCPGTIALSATVLGFYAVKTLPGKAGAVGGLLLFISLVIWLSFTTITRVERGGAHRQPVAETVPAGNVR